MPNRISKGILGGISGIVAAVSMELLKSGGYLDGSNIAIRAAIAGVIALLVFTGLNAMSGKAVGSDG